MARGQRSKIPGLLDDAHEYFDFDQEFLDEVFGPFDASERLDITSEYLIKTIVASVNKYSDELKFIKGGKE